MKAEYPHCDLNVLHEPGTCDYCDEYPERQQERLDNGVYFTGQGPDPASANRPLDTINRWGGNRPKKQLPDGTWLNNDPPGW